jgi:hypothetical protein
LAGGTENDGGIKVFGRAEGVILKQDGWIPVEDICRRTVVSLATYSNLEKIGLWFARTCKCIELLNGVVCIDLSGLFVEPGGAPGR